MHVVAFVLGSLAFTGHAHGRQSQLDSRRIASTTLAKRTKPHDITEGLVTANQLLFAKLLLAFNSAAAFRPSGLGFVGMHKGTALHPEGVRPALFADIRMDTKIPLEELKVGSDVEGKIQSTGDYAAFVDIGAEVNAFLHNSDISDEYAEKTVGDTVKGQILRIDLQGRKLAITCKPCIALEDLKVGAEIEGTVQNVKDFGAFVDVGAEVKGFLHKSDIAHSFVGDARRVFKAGDTVKARIKAIDVSAKKLAITSIGSEVKDEVQSDSPGISEDSAGKSEGEKKPLEQFEVDAEVQGRVVSVLDYGAFVDIGATVNALLHKSDISDKFVKNAVWALEVGELVKGRILSVDMEQQKLAMSCKEERMPLAKFEVGAEVQGQVTSVLDYGAFVDIGAEKNVLLPKSEISDKFVANTMEALAVGESVKGRVLAVDLEQQQLTISCKLDERTPLEKLEVGDEVQGKVFSVLDYGAFVDIGAEDDAFLSVKEMSDEVLLNATEALAVGDLVKGRILSIDVEQNKLVISCREDERIPLEKLEVGAEVQGKVTRVTDEYAFVDVGATQWGILYKDDMLGDFSINVGDMVKGSVRSINLGKQRFQITTKDRTPLEKLVVGDEVEGTVTNVHGWGVFVDIGASKDALMHISDMSNGTFVEDASKVYKSGQRVTVKIDSVDMGKVWTRAVVESD